MSEVTAKREPAGEGDRRRAVLSVEWFPKPRPAAPASVAGTVARMAVGAAAGGVLFRLGHVKLAVAAWSITALVGGASLVSPAAQAAIARGLAWFGRAAGSAVGTVLLTLVYFLALTPARFLKRLAGHDDLRLRDERLPSYYEPCDAVERKVRHARAMFATEVLRPRRRSLVAALATAAVLLGIAELLLRAQGFGPQAVVYTADARAGYYPSPGQKVDRYGGRVSTNGFGMRAPDFTPSKPKGKFRVLMLGDSTLWGGSYIDQDQLYARLLDRKLDEHAGGDDVEVLNMGVNGWGPFHERGFVETFGAFDADLVLVCLPHDDVDRDRYTLMSLPYFAEGSRPRFALEEVMMHTMWRFRRGRITLDGAWRERQRELGIQEYDRLAALLIHGDLRGDVADPPRTKVGGAEVFFEILPSRNVGLGGDLAKEETEADIVARMTKLLGARGVPVHYPAGLFRGKGETGDLYHDECHLHFQGHAVYADYLFGQITKESARFSSWMSQRSRKAP